MEIIYTTRPGTRHSVVTGGPYPVREIIVAGEEVGALYTGDGHLFGEVRYPDGTRQAYGDCMRDYSGAPGAMVARIMARRTLPPDADRWRAQVAEISAGHTVRCGD